MSDWKERGFSSEGELTYLEDRIRRMAALGEIDAPIADDLIKSGTQNDFRMWTTQVGPTLTQVGRAPETPTYTPPKVEAARPQPSSDTRPALTAYTQRLSDTLEEKAKQERLRTSGEPTQDEFTAIQQQAARDAEASASKLVTTPRTSPEGERVSSIWEDYFMTPIEGESPYITAARPQVVMTAAEQKAYDEAVASGDVGYLPRFLTWATTSPGPARTTESTIGWLLRLSNIPSAIVATGIDYAVTGDSHVPLSDRIARGEGLADLSRETATALTYGERFPSEEKVKLATGGKMVDGHVEGGSDKWTYPEIGAFVLGGLADIMVPFDLGLGEIGKGVRTGSKLAREAALADKSIGALSKGMIVGEAVGKGIADSWLNQIPMYTPTLSSSMKTRIADKIVETNQPKIQEWREWAIGRRNTEPAPEFSKDLGLPTQPEEAYQALSKALQHSVASGVSTTTYLGRMGIASKLMDESKGVARIGNVIFPVEKLPEVYKILHNTPIREDYTIGQLLKAIKVEDGMVTLNMYHLQEAMDSVGNLSEHLPVSVLDEIAPDLKKVQEMEIRMADKGMRGWAASPEVIEGKMSVVGFNRLVESMGEAIAMSHIPEAVDLRVASKADVPTAPELQTPKLVRELVAKAMATSVEADEILSQTSPMLRAILEEGKYRMGAAGQRIKARIAKAKGNAVQAFADPWVVRPQQMLVNLLGHMYGRMYVDDMLVLAHTPGTQLYNIAVKLQDVAKTKPALLADILNRVIRESDTLGQWLGRENISGVDNLKWRHMQATPTIEGVTANSMAVQTAALVADEQKVIQREIVSDLLAHVRRHDRTLYYKMKQYAQWVIREVDQIASASVTNAAYDKGIQIFGGPSGPKWQAMKDDAHKILVRDVIVATMIGGDITEALTNYQANLQRSIITLIGEGGHAVTFTPEEVLAPHLIQELSKIISTNPRTVNLMKAAEEYEATLSTMASPSDIKVRAAKRVSDMIRDIHGIKVMPDAEVLASSMNVDPKVAQYYNDSLRDIIPDNTRVKDVVGAYNLHATNSPNIYIIDELMRTNPDDLEKVF